MPTISGINESLMMHKLSEIKDLDLRNSGIVEVYEVQDRKIAIIMYAVVKSVDVCNVITYPSISIGCLSPDYSDIVDGSGDSNVRISDNNQFSTLNASVTAKIVGSCPETRSVKLNVLRNAEADAYLVDIDVFGYLIEIG